MVTSRAWVFTVNRGDVLFQTEFPVGGAGASNRENATRRHFRTTSHCKLWFDHKLAFHWSSLGLRLLVFKKMSESDTVLSIG